MNILNNSTIDTVIDFANVKFGMELTKEQVVSQLKGLSFSQTLKLLSTMKSDDGDGFSEIIDLSAVSEAYGTTQTAQPSRATIRSQGSGVDQRRATISNQDANRDSRGSQRYTAGSRKVPTGDPGPRTSSKSDPDDDQRNQNAQGIANNSNQSAYNAQEIERLKKAAGIA
jgi:hypothetical protein